MDCHVPVGAVAQMRERFRSGPPELRQAYMRLLLEKVEVGSGIIVLNGSNTVLERLATNGTSFSAPEVLALAREWRAVVVESENWRTKLSY